jgi:hypothetical protein
LINIEELVNFRASVLRVEWSGYADTYRSDIIASPTPFFSRSFNGAFSSIMATSGSSTCVISPAVELQPISISHPQDAKVAGLRFSDSKGIQDDDSPVDLPSPTTHPAVQPEQWNHPRSNLFKTMAAFWSFVVMGSNDAAYGALIPYVGAGVFDADEC